MINLLPPPDAGSSYLGVYGFGNPWVQWLIKRAPEFLGRQPGPKMFKGAPPCPECRSGMRWRMEPGEWFCNRVHDTYVCNTVRNAETIARTEKLYGEDDNEVSLLDFIGVPVDLVYDRRKWRVRRSIMQ